MDALYFYLFACLPPVIGGLLWLFGSKVHWGEWIGGGALGFMIAGIMHLIAAFGATADTETWSGHITNAVFYPEWIEEYLEVHVESYTDSDGNTQTRTYTTVEHRTHYEYWEAYSNIGTALRISPQKYDEMCHVFGNRQTERPYKGGFDSGDPNIYRTVNRDRGEYYPITDLRSFENKVRATPSTFSYAKVPATVKVFPYPENSNPWVSDRLLGSATLIDQLAFDRMNARLGPAKKVNVILVGFGDRDSMAAQWQEAAFYGGRKNDVVIYWGGLNKSPTWVRAFGWTDSKTCLRNLETLVLENGASTETLSLIEAEIAANYRLKDWDKAFAHIRVPAPMWAVWTYLIVALVGQGLFWWWAHGNEYDKDGSQQYSPFLSNYRYYRRGR
jgi:hypothetical protein